MKDLTFTEYSSGSEYYLEIPLFVYYELVKRVDILVGEKSKIDPFLGKLFIYGKNNIDHILSQLDSVKIDYKVVKIIDPYKFNQISSLSTFL